MCRMLCLVRDRSEAGLWDWMKEFAKLAQKGHVVRGASEGHEDGWGLAGYPRPDHPLLFRSDQSVLRTGPEFSDRVRDLETSSCRTIIAHLRKASAGGRREANSHPFRQGRWTFCHNGTISGTETLPLGSCQPQGDTDSERFFCYLLSCIQREGETVDGITRAVRVVHEKHPYTGLNFFLSDGVTLWVYRDYNERTRGGDPSRDELRKYFTLYRAEGAGWTAVCSEPIRVKDASWSAFGNRELLAIDSHLQVRSLQLEE